MDFSVKFLQMIVQGECMFVTSHGHILGNSFAPLKCFRHCEFCTLFNCSLWLVFICRLSFFAFCSVWCICKWRNLGAGIFFVWWYVVWFGCCCRHWVFPLFKHDPNVCFCRVDCCCFCQHFGALCELWYDLVVVVGIRYCSCQAWT